jgi:tagatose-6-phosphate ketose/aldose isomerase
MPASLSALERLLRRPVQDQRAAGYLHTAAEIASQPALWRKTAAVVLGALPELRTFCGGLPRVLLTGAGSSFYAALAVASSLRAAFPMSEAIPSTEIVTDPESAFPRDDFLLVSFARSGDSPEGNAAVALAEQLRPGAVRHMAVTCNRDGGLARIVSGLGARGSTILLPEETNDKSLAMTSSVTSLTIAGYGLAHLDSAGAYGAAVEGLARAATVLLARGSDLAAELAREGFQRMFFLASRPSVAGAHEAHLKVQELTGGRIIAKAEDTLGFRHGFMAAVDAQSLVVMHLSGDPYRRSYELDLLAELRAKGLGRKTLVVADSRAAADADLAGGSLDAVLEYGTDGAVTDAVRSPLVILPGQLLGLFCSLELGFKPDTPSPSGIINRVVQGVRIHPYETSR